MTDPIQVIESAYRLEASESEWLTGLARAVQANVASSEAMIAYTYQVRDSGWVEVASIAQLGLPVEFGKDMLGVGSTNDALEKAVSKYHHTTGMRSAVSALGSLLLGEMGRAYYERVLVSNGFRDIITIVATDPTSAGCLFAVPRIDAEAVHPSTQRRWDRLVAHIAAGLRLRRKLQSNCAPNEESSIDAVLRTDGRLDHANGPAQSRSARDALTAAVVASERARGRLRRQQPDVAVEVWRGLVAGRWSLVDQFESDGRRYVVARRNEPGTPDPRVLTARERQVLGYANLGHSNKLIAYALGLAPATVGALLTQARRKLGIVRAANPSGPRNDLSRPDDDMGRAGQGE